MRPVLGVLTVLGLVINRIRPATLQRARLDIIDAPMRVLRPLRGTVVTPPGYRTARPSGWSHPAVRIRTG